jgi:hypothetical protein
MNREEWLKGWEERMEAAIESQKTRSPEMARDMQKFVEEERRRWRQRGRRFQSTATASRLRTSGPISASKPIFR